MVKLICDGSRDLKTEIERKYTFSHYEVCGKIPDRLKGILKNDTVHTLPVDEGTRAFLLDKFKLRKDDVFLEVGTYYGFGTVKLSQLVKKVVAIEADKYNFNITKTNVEANCDNVFLINKAVGSKKGRSVFYTYQKEVGQGKSLVKESLPKVSAEYEVEVDTIDNILTQLNLMEEITFASLEINLGEADALLGAPTFLSKNNLRLLISAFYTHDSGKEASLVVKQILESHNFTVFIGNAGKVYAYK